MYYFSTDKPYVTFNKGKHFMRVNETQNVTVSCKVDSNPVASTIVLVKSSHRYHLKTRDSTLNFDLFNISRNDAGIYECRASNTIGDGYDSTEIIVQCMYVMYACSRVFIVEMKCFHIILF